MENTRIGQWKNGVVINRQTDESELTFESCQTCPSTEHCGLKYLYKEFGVKPEGSCVKFYSLLEVVIKHTQKLKEKSDLMRWIGI